MSCHLRRRRFFFSSASMAELVSGRVGGRPLSRHAARQLHQTKLASARTADRTGRIESVSLLAGGQAAKAIRSDCGAAATAVLGSLRAEARLGMQPACAHRAGGVRAACATASRSWVGSRCCSHRWRRHHPGSCFFTALAFV
jgi:hypothetical protein